MPASDFYIRNARERKASRLARVLDATGVDTPTLTGAPLDARGWGLASAVADIRTPSPSTRARALEILEHRRADDAAWEGARK